MPGRKPSGEGSIYRRGDGRWAGSAFVDTVSGQRKRIHVYATTRQEVHDRLADKLIAARRGIRTPDKEWTVGAYLDYWLNTVVTVKNRPHTAELYATTVRLRLKPALGSVRLSKLTVQDVQTLLNRHLAQGRSTRSVQLMRSVLRTALSRAMREELVVRNVAKLVDLPAWERKPIQPWTTEEAACFLIAAQPHRWYPAYAMLLLYGMRRGEVLGLRWCDVDFARGQLHIRQQLQRLGKALTQGPVKTAAGRRDLPLIPMLREALARQYVARLSGEHRPAEVIQHAASDHGLVFLSSTGTPIDPKNFVRTFHEIRTQADLPRITVHHTRHTAATILKNLGVPARDAQLILGHAHITTTQQLYQHADLNGQVQAMAQVEQQLITEGVAVKIAVKREFSTGEGTENRAFTSGGPGGTRTLDTLLKRFIELVESTAPTPVIRQLRTRAYARIVGRVAVKNCCQSTAKGVDDDTLILDYVALLHGLRHAETDIMRKRSFPLNLIPTTPRTPGPAP
ncbi:MAG: tyrosine-type recombinase/integrase [Pseudonocardiaceae bacterium]